MDKVKINIIYKDFGIVSIPFPNIKSCDEFTVGYQNNIELANTLARILNFNIGDKKIVDVYLEYSYQSRMSDRIITKQLPVKYSCDNFDFDDLRLVFAKFYQDDRDRIFEEDGIRNVQSSVMRDYINKRTTTITDTSIQITVNSYLKNNYKANRDAYFLLKQNGYSVKINEVFVENYQTPNGLGPIDMKSGYFNYLKKYASQGQEEMAEVMDEIQRYDVEELREEIGISGYDNFDTIRKNSYQQKYSGDDELLELEGLTGKSIDELKELLEIYKNEVKNGRSR